MPFKAADLSPVRLEVLDRGNAKGPGLWRFSGVRTGPAPTHGRYFTLYATQGVGRLGQVAHLQRGKLLGVGPGLCGLPRIPYFWATR
jgi:hypothetical protein